MNTVLNAVRLLCGKCRVPLKPGSAIVNSWESHDDFGADAGSDGCTVTQTGPPKVIACWKCPQCGHSVEK